MHTKNTVSHAHVHAPVASTSEPSPASSPAAVTEAGAPSSTVVAGGAGATVPLFLSPPPATANIPGVPSNFLPESGADYRGTAPKKSELVALPLAVKDLRNFTNYMQVIGSTAPAYASILEMFEVTNAWSSMRTSSAAWDAYCQNQEGICWQAMRSAMERLKPAFQLAASGDPSLTTKYAGLATLLGAKKAIAKKAASTKKLNKKAIAEGKEPTHGQVGKNRKKAQNKAIVAAAASAEPVPASPVQAAPTPATPTPTPATNGAPATTPAPAAAPALNGASATPH